MKYDTYDRNIQRILNDLYVERFSIKHFFARTANGKDIYINQETIKQMKRHPELDRTDIIDAIKKIDDYNDDFYIRSIDIGRTVGKDDCVNRDLCQEISLLYKKGNKYPLPISVDTEPQDTSMVTVVLCKNKDGQGEFLSAFYGLYTPRHPWDVKLEEYERKESEEFWRNHVLVMDPDDIDWNKSTPVKLYDGNLAEILSISGFNDSFYWECLARFRVKDDIYYMYDCGTNVEQCTHQEIVKGTGLINKSFQLMRIKEHGYDFTNIFPDCVNEKIFVQEMYQKFMESGAKELFTYSEGKDFKEIWIDDIPNRYHY